MLSSNKIRVVINNRPSALTQPGGDTVVMQHTINELTKLGVEVCLDLEGTANLSDCDLVHIFNFATPQITEAFAKRAAEAKKPFVVTTLSEDAPGYRNQAMEWARFLAEYVARGQDRAWFNNNKPDLNKVPAANRFQNDWVANNAAALLTNGATESSVICRDYGNLRIREVYLGYDFNSAANKQLFENKFGVSDFVLCVGRLEFRKNQLALLKALEDSKLTVVLAAGGFSYDPAYAEACRNFKRAGKTIVTDRLDAETLASAYKAARVHALPSWYELPGLVSLEAAHYGCQVVVSDRGTTRDYLGNLAWYCDPFNPESIRRAVEQAWSATGNQELEEHISKFSWSAMAQQTLKVYQEVLKFKPTREKQEDPVDIKIKLPTDTSGAKAPEAVVVGGYDMAAGVTEFQDLLERGELAAKERQYNIAHELLARAEQLNSMSARAARARGAVFLAENMIPSAKRYFEKAIRLDDNDPKAYSGLGMCYMTEQQSEAAYDCFVKSLVLDNGNLVTILQLLECSYLLNRFDDLTRVLEDYLDAHPNDKDMRFCLAGALYKQNNFQRANEICKQVLTIAPDHQGAQELSKAIEESNKLNSENGFETKNASSVPSNEVTGAVDMNFEQMLAELEDKKHRREFTEVLDISSAILAGGGCSNDYRERFELLKAEALLLTGKLAEGAQIFKAILEANPRCARAICGQGALAATAGQWREAKNLFERALSFNQRSDVALAGLAMCASSENNTELAWDLFNQALSINPENVRALLGVMEIGYSTKRFAEVEQVLRAYLDLHPADTQFMYSLSGCLYAQNKIDEAVNELGRLTLIDPQHSGAKELIGIIAQRESGAVGV